MRHPLYVGTLGRMLNYLRTISLTPVVVVLAYLSFFHGSFDTIADDPGLGWHLANGAIIDATGRIPATDPFLAEARHPNPYAPVDEPRRWINEQWLADLILYKLHSLGGWPLLYACVAGLFLVAYFGIAGDGLRRSGQGGILVLAALVCAFKLGQVHLVIRPVIFSIALFPLVLRRVHRLIVRGDSEWLDVRREGVVLGGLFLVWANLHPAFVYGLCVVALAMLSQLTRGKAGMRSAVRWGALGVLCCIATLCNPSGVFLYESIARLGGSPYLRSLTMEWYPLDLTRPEGALLMTLSVIPAFCAAIRGSIRKRLSRFDVLVALFFVPQALWAVRIVPFASFACLPLWSACFGDSSIIPKYRVFELTARVVSALTGREGRIPSLGLKSSVCAALVGLVCIVSVPGIVLPAKLGSVHERRLQTIFAPVDTGNASGVIFASPDWGGAITRLFGPRYKPVYDDRTVVIGEALYRAYFESLQNPATFHSLATAFDVTHVLAPTDGALSSHLRELDGWREISRFEGDSLFLDLHPARSQSVRYATAFGVSP